MPGGPQNFCFRLLGFVWYTYFSDYSAVGWLWFKTETQRDESASCGGAGACWEDISISAFLSRALETAHAMCVYVC